jgi:hypothetical protein
LKSALKVHHDDLHDAGAASTHASIGTALALHLLQRSLTASDCHMDVQVATSPT